MCHFYLSRYSMQASLGNFRRDQHRRNQLEMRKVVVTNSFKSSHIALPQMIVFKESAHLHLIAPVLIPTKVSKGGLHAVT